MLTGYRLRGQAVWICDISDLSLVSGKNDVFGVNPSLCTPGMLQNMPDYGRTRDL